MSRPPSLSARASFPGSREVAAAARPACPAVKFRPDPTAQSPPKRILEGVGRRLEAEFGLRAAAEMRRGDPAAELVRAAGRESLLVMATRDRYGLGGLWAGSVSARVVAAGRGPVLLVPAP